MADFPRFVIDCRGCGRRGTTTSVHELFTVEYCPDCAQRLQEQATNQQDGGQ